METLERTEPVIAPPPRRWRNWWRVLAPITLITRGVPMGPRAPGDYKGETCWPSRERAEEVAVKASRENPVTFANMEYLGAFPDGEEPGDARAQNPKSGGE